MPSPRRRQRWVRSALSVSKVTKLMTKAYTILNSTTTTQEIERPPIRLLKHHHPPVLAPLPQIPPLAIEMHQSSNDDDQTATATNAETETNDRPSPTITVLDLNDTTSTSTTHENKDKEPPFPPHDDSTEPHFPPRDSSLHPPPLWRTNSTTYPWLHWLTPHRLHVPHATWLPFKPHMWPSIDRAVPHLELDLFAPCTFHPRRAAAAANPYADPLGPEHLRPLTEFRGLKTLKVTGMMESYQSWVWQAVWLCDGLEELTLEMGLRPEVKKGVGWRWMGGGWVMERRRCKYRGVETGKGTLAQRYGFGEYLDYRVIGKARQDALRKGPVGEKISLVKLNLHGFVVDRLPFERWFDQGCLREINFVGDCFDAGFWIDTQVFNVNVITPSSREEDDDDRAGHVFPPQSAKLIDVKLQRQWEMELERVNGNGGLDDMGVLETTGKQEMTLRGKLEKYE